MAMLHLELYPHLIKLLISQVMQLLQSEPELASEVTKSVLVVGPALKEVL